MSTFMSSSSNEEQEEHNDDGNHNKAGAGVATNTHPSSSSPAGAPPTDAGAAPPPTNDHVTVPPPVTLCNLARSNRASVEPLESGNNVAESSSRQRRVKKTFAVSTQWEQQQLQNGGVPGWDVHRIACCCARRLGNMHLLLSSRDGSPLVIAGPCWPFCLFVTVPLIVGISSLVAYFFVVHDYFSLPIWILYIYVPAVVLVLALLFCVSCRDPGLMERVTDEEAGEGGWFWNEQVGSYRPPGALYCRECGVLIQEYDHLCPWTGTGIGGRNMWAFKSFVVGVNVLCYLSLGIVIWALLQGLRIG